MVQDMHITNIQHKCAYVLNLVSYNSWEKTSGTIPCHKVDPPFISCLIPPPGFQHEWRESMTPHVDTMPTSNSRVKPLKTLTCHDDHFASLVSPEVIAMTTYGATNDDKVCIMTTKVFSVMYNPVPLICV